MTFFQRLSQTVNDAAKDIDRGVRDLHKQAETKWQDVQVRCPNCQVMLTVPPPPALVFQCGQCGTQINRPSTGSILSHQLDKIGDTVSSSVNQAMGSHTPMQITIPAGVKPGDIIPVQAAVGAPTVNVTVPPGAEPGQTITVQMPAYATVRQTAPRVATTTVTPTCIPVAAVAGQGGSASASGGYTNAAPPAAASSPTSAGQAAGTADGNGPVFSGVAATSTPEPGSTAPANATETKQAQEDSTAEKKSTAADEKPADGS